MSNQKGRELSNTDLCLWAMYSLKAQNRAVDVEEIYLKLFEIAPSKFSWRTRPDLPNMRNGLTALGKLEKDLFPEFVIKVSPTSRMLSDMGVEWIEANSETFAGLGHGEKVLPSRQGKDFQLARSVQDSEAWNDWKSNVPLDVEKLADAFSCSLTSSEAVWQSRLNSVAEAGDALAMDQLIEFVSAAREIVKKEI